MYLIKALSQARHRDGHILLTSEENGHCTKGQSSRLPADPEQANNLSMRNISLLIVAMALLAQAHAALGQAQKEKDLPAPAEAAVETLKSTPRHGEWVQVPLPGSDVKLKTWVVYPERKDKAPVVIVIHEIFGLTDWVRAVADQLAADGFLAVAPDLLSGKGPEGGGTESFAGDAVRAAIGKLTDDELVERLDAAKDWALAQPSAGAKFATVGFCWGGTVSFMYATRQPKLGAAVVYYGTGPSDEAAMAKIQAPVLGLYGGDDARVTSTVQATDRAMVRAGKAFTHHTYEGAGHGFLRQQSGRDGANLKAAKAAWEETVEFLKKNLER